MLKLTSPLSMISAIVVLAVSGCATMHGYQLMVGTWIGHHTDELISKWGPPTSITPLSSGAVLQYARVRTVSSGGYSYSVPRTINTNASAFGSGGWAVGNAQTTVYDQVNVPVSYEQRACVTNFTCDAKRIITAINFAGKDCVAVPPSNTEQQNITPNPSPTTPLKSSLGLGVLWH